MTHSRNSSKLSKSTSTSSNWIIPRQKNLIGISPTKNTWICFLHYISKIDNCALSGNPGNEPKSSKYSITFCDKPAFFVSVISWFQIFSHVLLIELIVFSLKKFCSRINASSVFWATYFNYVEALFFCLALITHMDTIFFCESQWFFFFWGREKKRS